MPLIRAYRKNNITIFSIENGREKSRKIDFLKCKKYANPLIVKGIFVFGQALLKNPNLEIIPIQMRLVKYHIDDNTYCLGTTLIDKKRYNNIQDFIDIYHARWGVEELYKVSKQKRMPLTALQGI